MLLDTDFCYGRAGKYFLYVASAWMLSACTTYSLEKDESYEPFDTASQIVADWGTAHMSSPILSTVPDWLEFKLDDYNPEQAFDNAKSEVNAGVAYFIQTILNASLGVSQQTNTVSREVYQDVLEQYLEESRYQAQTREAIREEAIRIYETCISLANQQFSLADAEADEQQKLSKQREALNENQACQTAYLATLKESKPDKLDNDLPEFRDFALKKSILDQLQKPEETKSLLQTTAYKLPDHFAMRQAQANYLESAMYRLLTGKEHLNKTNNNYLLGVASLSVTPGRYTQAGYRANINIQPYTQFTRRPLQGQYAFLEDVSQPEPHRWLLYLDMERKQLCNADICDQYRRRLLTRLQAKQISANAAFISGKDPEESLTQHELRSLLVGGDKIFATFYEAQLANAWKMAQRIAPLLSDSDLEASDKLLAVTAISPIQVGQTLDLSNRQLSQIQMSLMLAQALKAPGTEQQAELFAEFARKKQQDYVSRSLDNQVNISHFGDELITVEVGPTFVANTLTGSRPSLELQRQTFPILFLVNEPNGAIKKLHRLSSDCDQAPSYLSSCALYVTERSLGFTISSQWLQEGVSNDSRNFWQRWFGSEPPSISQMLELGQQLRGICGDAGGSQYVQHLCTQYGAKLVGTFHTQPIPVPRNSTSTKPVPGNITEGQ